MHRLSVAFHHVDNTLWTGAVTYLWHLFKALQALPGDERPEIVLLVPRDARPESVTELESLVDRVLTEPESPSGGGGGRRGWMARLRSAPARRRGPFESWAPFLREAGVAALFARRSFGDAFGFPLVSLIPDFQHLHLPEMFSSEELATRDRIYAKTAQRADRVVLSSRDARRDFLQFVPAYREKGRVVSFVADVPSQVFERDPADVCRCYHLPERFIYLPNQFWKHKNHELVVDALALAVRSHPDITIVCTGNTTDFRNPLFLPSLLMHIAEQGLRANFAILGLVPFDDVYRLLRQSTAVLQPSLFEGWNTCVEETKSIGKRMIISDLPVHREQDPPESVFFDPHDAASLAQCLVRAYESFEPGPDARMEAAARDALPGRKRDFANCFMDVVREAIASCGTAKEA